MPGLPRWTYDFNRNYVGGIMTKLDELKVKLIQYNRTKSITMANDICRWLYKELVKEPKKIEVKEG